MKLWLLLHTVSSILLAKMPRISCTGRILSDLRSTLNAALINLMLSGSDTCCLSVCQVESESVIVAKEVAFR